MQDRNQREDIFRQVKAISDSIQNDKQEVMKVKDDGVRKRLMESFLELKSQITDIINVMSTDA